jgi:hypothetical protein
LRNRLQQNPVFAIEFVEDMPRPTRKLLRVRPSQVTIV